MDQRLENGSFYGRAGAPLLLSDVVLAETSYEDGFVVPVHAHTHPFFCLMLSGRMVEHFERPRVLGPRTVFYHPAEATHAESFEAGPARLFNIQFGADWIRDLARFDVQLPTEHIALPMGSAPWIAARIYDEARGGRERLVIEGLLLAMVGEVVKCRPTRERTPGPAWLRAVLDQLHAHIAEDVGLGELAKTAQVHPSHLARTFRAVHGCTIGEYVRRMRVERARELLEHSDLSLSSIAFACGFADQSHLTRVFRHLSGSTPSAYRRAFRSRRASP